MNKLLKYYKSHRVSNMKLWAPLLLLLQSGTSRICRASPQFLFHSMTICFQFHFDLQKPVPEVAEWTKTVALHSWLYPQLVIWPSTRLQSDFAKTLNAPVAWPYILNIHPAPQICSPHVLSYTEPHLRKSTHWKEACATPVINDNTFVHVLIHLL